MVSVSRSVLNYRLVVVVVVHRGRLFCVLCPLLAGFVYHLYRAAGLNRHLPAIAGSFCRIDDEGGDDCLTLPKFPIDWRPSNGSASPSRGRNGLQKRYSRSKMEGWAQPLAVCSCRHQKELTVPPEASLNQSNEDSDPDRHYLRVQQLLQV